MPARVGVSQRVIAHIGIAVPVQGVVKVRHQRIRLDEERQRGVVPARVVVVQPAERLCQLPGVAVGGGQLALGRARLAKGSIAQFRAGRAVCAQAERRGETR